MQRRSLVSSMEMYGKFEKEGEKSPYIDEETLGYINPLEIRSNYPESKRMCENMCVAYKKQYDLPVSVARLSQTFGAGILQTENRVFAQFARSAIRGEDIVLHTLGKSEGNTYGYAADTCMKLNTSKMQSLGWKPEIGLEEAYKRMIESMRNTKNY